VPILAFPRPDAADRIWDTLNIRVPGRDQEFSFLAIMLMMGVMLPGSVANFRRRGWL